MASKAVVPIEALQQLSETPEISQARKVKKKAPRKRRRHPKPMDSDPIRSLVPTPVPSIIYPDIPSFAPSPFTTPPESPRKSSPAPVGEHPPEDLEAPEYIDCPQDGAEELQHANSEIDPIIVDTEAPASQDSSHASLSSGSTRTRTASVGPTSSSSSSSKHSGNNGDGSNAASSLFVSARERRPRLKTARRARKRRRRSFSSPNGRYRLHAMKQAKKKGRPVKYGVTRDLRAAFMRGSGTVKTSKRKAFGCCVIQ